ncbi:actin cytoskeleton-regulatory complex protein PAN1-like [Miscanthus floridulus]|uniref:actin cytoskeleton-regulatory complex protein PAN1-like n=1 Tax=Miscanthus floridulus TaxID=154761 RepID=UPI00345AADF8
MIDKKKKKAFAKNVTAEAESKKRKGASVARALVKKKKKSGALVIAPAASSVGSAGVASTGSEDVQSSSVPSVHVRVTSGEDRSSPGAPVCPVSGAVSGAGRAEASAALARTLHGATSVAEQPEASVADPMPDIFGGLYSSSEEGTEAILQHAPLSPAVVAPSPAPAANVGQPEAVLAEQAPAAQSSSSPPPARPLAEESRPFGPSPHDMAGTSAQGARQAA